MRIVIIGAGKVGKSIISHMCQEKHDLCIIDSNYKVVNELVNQYDIIGVFGNGANINIQKKAYVDKSDLVITCTSSDETNILACLVAKKIGAKNTIARIRNHDYYEQINFMKKDLGLSLIINPEQEAASEITRILEFPQALKIDTFAKGKVDLMEIYITSGSPLIGESLKTIRHKYQVQVLVCAVERGNNVYIPSGDFILEDKDKISITGTRHEIVSFLNKLGYITKKIDSVMVIGGGKIAVYLGNMLSKNHYKVKIIERDEKRCEELSVLLPKATIICGDGTDQTVLHEEGFDTVDACISLTGIDEENILTSMYAATQKIPKVIAKVNRNSFINMIESVGVASVVSPKESTAVLVVSYVRALVNSRGSNVVTLYKLVNGRVEALEFIVNSNSKCIDIPLKNLKLKKGILIAAIIRNNETRIPDANDCFKVNDSVIVVTTNAFLDNLDDILQ